MNRAELGAWEYLCSLEDSRDAVGENRWAAWWNSLSEEARKRRIAHAADKLQLPWPHTRRYETISQFAGLTLSQLIAKRGIGKKKARTIVWAIGLTAWDDNIEALAEDVRLGPNIFGHPPGMSLRPEEDARTKNLETAPTPKEPDPVDMRLEGAITSLEDLDHDESATNGLELLEGAVAALAGRHAKNTERGKRLRIIISARLGEDPATLQDIGDLVALTRERVRQILVQSTRKLRRSHSGLELRLVELYQRWALSGRSEGDLERLQHILREMFGKQDRNLLPPSKSLTTIVPKVVRRAYLDGDTPLEFSVLLERLRQRLGGEPDPDAVQRALNTDRVVVIEAGDQQLIYSNSAKDAIHRALIEAGRPLDHEELQAATGLTRNTLYSLTGKDLRFIQQDDGTWMPFRELPVREISSLPQVWVIDGWRRETNGDMFDDLIDTVFADVTPRKTTREAAEIPLDDLIAETTARLGDKEVFNATVWGFWRACAAVAEDRFHADLPDAVSAVPLARLATDRTSHVVSGGKRRIGNALKPESVEEQGNAYWIRRALADLGGPCTPSEFSRALDAYYQDGPDYLHKMWIEFYGEELGLRRFAPASRPATSVLVPTAGATWDGGPTEGVRRLARRLARSQGSRHERLSRSEFEGAEWLADLIEEFASGYDWGMGS